MPYFQKHHCLFIHIPKNAGSTIEEIFKQNDDFHSSTDELYIKWREFQELYPHGLKYGCSPQHMSYEEAVSELQGRPINHVLTIVRHPMRRLISEYFYQKNHLKNKIATTSFKTFIEYYMRPEHIHIMDRHLMPQYMFLRSFPSYFGKIFHLENIESVFDYLNNELSLNVNRKTHQLRNMKKEDIYVNTSLLLQIGQFYSIDFTTFGYDLFQNVFNDKFTYYIVSDVPNPIKHTKTLDEAMNSLEEKINNRMKKRN